MHGVPAAAVRPPTRVPAWAHAPMRHPVGPERRERDTPLNAAGAIVGLWLVTVLVRVLWVHLRKLAHRLSGLS